MFAACSVSLRGGHAAPGCARWLSQSARRCGSHYETLGVKSSAKGPEIKSQFYAMSKQWHPDKHGGSREATARFQEISEAYGTLSDDAKRLDYDRRNGFASSTARGPQAGSAYGQRSAHARTSEEHWRRHYGDPARGPRYGGEPFGPGYQPPNSRQPRMDRRHVRFDFDEWYRQHYGEDAIRRARAHQRTRQVSESARKESFARFVTFVVMMTFIVTISAAGRRQRDGW